MAENTEEKISPQTEETAEKFLVDFKAFDYVLDKAVKKGWGTYILNKVYDLLGYNSVDFSLIKVTLTFEDMLPMTLVFGRQLSEDKEKSKEGWLGMTDEEINANVYEYNVRLLAELLKQEPVNLPNYPTVEDGTIKNRFIQYFLKYENKVLFRFINSAWEKKQYPKELS